jgi:hypothetical protein
MTIVNLRYMLSAKPAYFSTFLSFFEYSALTYVTTSCTLPHGDMAAPIAHSSWWRRDGLIEWVKEKALEWGREIDSISPDDSHHLIHPAD